MRSHNLRHRKQRAFLAVLALASVAVSQVHPTAALRQEFLRKFSATAIERTQHAVRYDPAYVRIPYPGGDVPAGTGVCTDEVIRSYRALGIDLQKEVHEDMAANFGAYPSKWHRQRPDSNIDHRRVPNLMVFFSRNGETLPITNWAEDYAPGDLVTWELGGGATHIGIVVDRKTMFTRRYMIEHNIGAGRRLKTSYSIGRLPATTGILGLPPERPELAGIPVKPGPRKTGQDGSAARFLPMSVARKQTREAKFLRASTRIVRGEPLVRGVTLVSAQVGKYKAIGV